MNTEIIMNNLKTMQELHLEDDLHFQECKNRIMESIGDDEDAVKDFIKSLDGDDLGYMTSVFEDIYGKFMNDDMYDFLENIYNEYEKQRMKKLGL